MRSMREEGLILVWISKDSWPFGVIVMFKVENEMLCRFVGLSCGTTFR